MISVYLEIRAYLTSTFYVILISVTVTVKANLPFGKPRVIQENQDYCLLYHREYISGFAKALMMPLWSSYTVPNPVRKPHPMFRGPGWLRKMCASFLCQGLDFVWLQRS